MIATILLALFVSAGQTPVTCGPLAVAVRDTMLVPCASGLCSETGAVMVAAPRPVRQVLPGPADGLIVLHTGRELSVWLGKQLVPLLDLGDEAVLVRPVGRERLALARPSAKSAGSVVISLLEAGGTERVILSVKARVLDFACSSDASCLIVTIEPDGSRRLTHYEDATARPAGVIPAVQRVFWSSSRRLAQAWDGSKLHEAGLIGQWGAVRGYWTHAGCPVIDADTGLVAPSPRKR